MKIELIAALSILLVLVGCMIEPPKVEKEDCPVCPIIEEKAQLDIILDSYYQDASIEENGFFAYWVVNYGDVEAKDVVVECLLYDQTESVVVRQKQEIGSVASNNAVYKELITKYPDMDPQEAIGSLCSIISCSKCDILTWKIKPYSESLGRFFNLPETG